MRFRVMGAGIFSVMAIWMAVGEWPRLWWALGPVHLWGFVGWGLTTMGLLILGISQPLQVRRMGVGMALVLFGLGLLWVPQVETGAVSALRVGVGAAALAFVPRVWMNLRQSRRRARYLAASAHEDAL